MKRRDFLKTAVAGVGALAVRDSLWSNLFAAPATDGAPYYGSMPDENGLHLPPGYTSRRIAVAVMPVIGASGLPVGFPGYTFPIFPDGAWAFPDTELDGNDQPVNPGGWILVVNTENPPPPDARIFPAGIQELFGGASAIRFDASGGILDAYPVLGGTQTNCAGGPTPWGTWLSCEEYDNSIRSGATSDAGRVWECDPTGKTPGIVHEALGRFKHEAAAFDDEGRVYLTEDVGDGLLYRFTPAAGANTPASLAAGTLEAWSGNPAGGPGTWVSIPDPGASSVSTRKQNPNATPFRGGEGVAFAPYHPGPGGRIYFTTKGDDHVRAIDTLSGELEVVYDGSPSGSVLTGVDNIIVSAAGHAYVAEDGGSMEIVRIEGIGTGSPVARPFLKLTGPMQGLVGVNYDPVPIPLESEITGPAISPDGKRLYFSSQREGVFGAVYEITAGPDATVTL